VIDARRRGDGAHTRTGGRRERALRRAHRTRAPLLRNGTGDQMTIPSTMRALELSSRDAAQPLPELGEKAIPEPRRGEVLIRVAAAPINPNDLLFLRDRYEVKKRLPVVLGFEGSGMVVGAGGGVMARAMVGRRVACSAGDGDGTWAEYVTVPATRCAPLR